MNKLRELIAKFEKIKVNANWRARAIHRDNLEVYLMDNAEAIADLIDAARHLVGACTTGDVSRDGKPVGVRMPSNGDVDQLRAALTKLEETK